MRLKFVALVVSALSVLVGLSVISTPEATAAGCLGGYRLHATEGGQAFDPWAVGFDAYWTGTATVGRSPCWSGTQRIYLVHQSFKYVAGTGWVTFTKTSNSAVVRSNQHAYFGSKQEYAHWFITARTYVYWYTYGGQLIAKKTFDMNSSSWYHCVDTRVCIVAYDANRWHLHFLI